MMYDRERVTVLCMYMQSQQVRCAVLSRISTWSGLYRRRTTPNRQRTRPPITLPIRRAAMMIPAALCNQHKLTLALFPPGLLLMNSCGVTPPIAIQVFMHMR